MRTMAQSERTTDRRWQSPKEYAQGEVRQGVFGAVERAYK